jgi:hypothetical protein
MKSSHAIYLFAAITMLVATATPARADNLTVLATTPARHTMASVNASIVVDFDRAVDPATVTTSTFRVFGKWSGVRQGAFTYFSDTVIFTPFQPFSAGEVVTVTLSHDITGADAVPLRPGGYTFQFMTSTTPTAKAFWELDVMSNRIANAQTRIYGACAADLNADGYPDLTTVNEVSADVRVFMNKADGTGLFHDMLAPQGIASYASPNEPADFNDDGHTDLCIAVTENDSVWVLLGSGDGTFYDITPYPAGRNLHNVATLDADGDGDTDMVTAHLADNMLGLHLNNGNGTFAPATYFNGNVNGEDGLATADMDNDGILDIIVAGRWSRTIQVHKGNGDGTFTAIGTPQNSGGETWVLALGDLNADGNIDVTCANNFFDNGSVLLGNGDGTLGLPTLMPTGARVTSTDLGDLDGDGDLDWVLSSFGGHWWRMYTNDGSGNFTLFREIPGPANPSCAVLVDLDRDGDLDMALTDEIADVVVLMENTDNLVGIGDGPGAGPQTTPRLLQNAPNPFAHSTTVRFHLSEAGDARLELFDVTGRRIQEHTLPGLPAGWHELRINATDATGTVLPSGIYFYKVTARGWSDVQRMVLSR